MPSPTPDLPAHRDENTDAAPLRVLFVCIGNSARSIIAEAVANHPTFGLGVLQASSAGGMPRPEPHPLALQALTEAGVGTTGLYSKGLDQFGPRRGLPIDLTITVCDHAVMEMDVIGSDWPSPVINWPLPDPAAVRDNPSQAFRDTLWCLSQRVRLLAEVYRKQPRQTPLAEAQRLAGVN